MSPPYAGQITVENVEDGCAVLLREAVKEKLNGGCHSRAFYGIERLSPFSCSPLEFGLTVKWFCKQRFRGGQKCVSGGDRK